MKAFPHTKYFSDHHDNDHMNGMDLRDYFAAKVAQGLVGRTGRTFEKDDVKLCYELADAMMEARNAK